uniref:Kinesin-like protein n=1 Tax=Podarcis muralis TaxID=64176 RepID=A0A670JBY6_PODMU
GVSGLPAISMKSCQRLSRYEAQRTPSNAPARVRVCVRLRPSVGTGEGKEAPCVRGVDSCSLEILNVRNNMETMKYKFDAYYSATATQYDVYMGSVQPILHHLLEGQNASILAYGPTGAGKTYTMLGSPEQPGVIPRAVQNLLQMTRDASGDQRKYSVSMSYLEIYQEKVLDLLEPSLRDLPIREDQNHHILVPGLTEREITSFSDFEKHFLPASSNRTVASTQLNNRSSRSHAVLLVYVSQTRGWPPYAQRAAKLCLIDLAGSEDNRRTGNRGVRLKESGAINTSLFVLSKVVDALNKGLPRVPYRDSKLTRLLQDSLGGSAHSLIIANIAPERKYYFETLTSLNFAAKSKQVVNKPFTQETLLDVAVLLWCSQILSCHSTLKALSSSLWLVRKDRPYFLVSFPTSSLLPMENLEPALAEKLLHLEALETQQAGAESCALPLLNTPRSERLEFRRLLEETRRELQVKTLFFMSHRDPSKTAMDEGQSGNRRVRHDTTSYYDSCYIQDSAPGSENKVPSEWEMVLQPELMARTKENILAILNTGSVKDLMALHQIGKKKANRIVAWRGEHGCLASG